MVLPSDIVTCANLDARGDLWIGTFLGLRILSNASSSMEEDKMLR